MAEDDPLSTGGALGSGKSTLALKLMNGNRDQVIENDDYWFVPSGKRSIRSILGPLTHYWSVAERLAVWDYRYEPQMTHLAGAWCGAEAFRRLRLFDEVAVANTFIKRAHIVLYIEEAKKLGVRIKIHEPSTEWFNDATECNQKNVHGVPLETIMRMKSEYEPMSQEDVDELLGAPCEK